MLEGGWFVCLAGKALVYIVLADSSTISISCRAAKWCIGLMILSSFKVNPDRFDSRFNNLSGDSGGRKKKNHLECARPCRARHGRVSTIQYLLSRNVPLSPRCLACCGTTRRHACHSPQCIVDPFPDLFPCILKLEERRRFARMKSWKLVEILLDSDSDSPIRNGM